ncbi:MAG: 4Fe-4S dicluster domain-containing protein [Dehalococcoidia bacterium]
MCSLKKTGSFNPAQARIRVVEDLHHGSYQPVFCLHCQVAKCQQACPEDAIEAHRKLPRVVVIDQGKCTGCLECVNACPFGAIVVGPQGEVLKCDLCDGEPVCVKYCYETPAHSSPSLPYPRWKALEYTEFHKVNLLKAMARGYIKAEE